MRKNQQKRLRRAACETVEKCVSLKPDDEEGSGLSVSNVKMGQRDNHWIGQYGSLTTWIRTIYVYCGIKTLIGMDS